MNKLLKILGLGFALLLVMILLPADKIEAASLYTPFGGQVEKYIPVSDAQCVINSCDKINEPIHDAVKTAISGPRDAFCLSVVAPLCSVIPIVGNIACYVACVKMIDKSVEDSIDICSVEELRVGPPLPVTAGILDIGTIKIKPTLTIPIPFLPDVHIKLPFVDFSISNLIPGFSNIIPSANVYLYGEYKTEGNWVLGSGLNLRRSCFENDSPPSLCNNPITRIMIRILSNDIKNVGKDAFDEAIEKGVPELDAELARKEAEIEHADSCPLLNLIHQVGSSQSLESNFSL